MPVRDFSDTGRAFLDCPKKCYTLLGYETQNPKPAVQTSVNRAINSANRFWNASYASRSRLRYFTSATSKNSAALGSTSRRASRSAAISQPCSNSVACCSLTSSSVEARIFRNCCSLTVLFRACHSLPYPVPPGRANSRRCYPRLPCLVLASFGPCLSAPSHATPRRNQSSMLGSKLQA